MNAVAAPRPIGGGQPAPSPAVLLVGFLGTSAADLGAILGDDTEIVSVEHPDAAWTVLEDPRIMVVALGRFDPASARTFLEQLAARWPSRRTVNLILEGGRDPGEFQTLLEQDRLYYVSPRLPSEAEIGPLLVGALGVARGRVAAGPPFGPPPTQAARSVVALARRLALQDDPADLAEQLGEAARPMVDADRAYVLLHDPLLDALWARDPASGVRRLESAAVGLASFVFRSGLAVDLERLDADPRFDRDLDDPESRGGERFLAVPLRDSGCTIGVLIAVRGADRGLFSTADRDTLQGLADVAGPYAAPWVLEIRPEAVTAGPEVAAGPFRRSAVERHQRGDDAPADPLRISPAWSRRSYRLLLAAAAALLGFVLFGSMREYAAGDAIVRMAGRTELTARAAGSVFSIDVAADETVRAGQVLARFYDRREAADLERLESEMRIQLANRLRDPEDRATEQVLIGLRTERELARARLEERVLRAPFDGVVGDVWVRAGQFVEPGQPVASLAAGAADPTVTMVLPGRYRPMLAVGMPVRLSLAGYRYAYQPLVIETIGEDVVAPGEAPRVLDPAVAELVTGGEPVVLVSARLPSETFEADGRTFAYHDGMRGTVDVPVRAERILFVLLPGLRAMFGNPEDGAAPGGAEEATDIAPISGGTP